MALVTMLQGWFGAYSDYVHRQAYQFLRQPWKLVDSTAGASVDLS